MATCIHCGSTDVTEEHPECGACEAKAKGVHLITAEDVKKAVGALKRNCVKRPYFCMFNINSFPEDYTMGELKKLYRNTGVTQLILDMTTCPTGTWYLEGI